MENNNHQQQGVTLEDLKAHEQEIIAQIKGFQMMLNYNRQMQESAKNPKPTPQEPAAPREMAGPHEIAPPQPELSA